MARHAGTRGRIYAAIASSGTAEPITFLKSWSLDQTVDQFEVTSFEDSTKTYVAGKPDSKGSFEGFDDESTQQFWTAASDGVARKVYLYPDTNTTSRYWYGTATFSQSISVDSGGPVGMSGSFAAATPFVKVG